MFQQCLISLTSQWDTTSDRTTSDRTASDRTTSDRTIGDNSKSTTSDRTIGDNSKSNSKSKSRILQLANDDNDTISRIGLPFIAGWLLGYPCIYHVLPYNDNDSNDEMSTNCLSMQTLIKYSILGHYKTVDTTDTTNNNNNNNTTNDTNDDNSIDILEFTIPKTIIDNDINIQTIVSDIINNRINTIKCNITITNNNDNNDDVNKSIPLLSNIVLHNNEFTLSSVVL
jgi:hypothetical protein